MTKILFDSSKQLTNKQLARLARRAARALSVAETLARCTPEELGTSVAAGFVDTAIQSASEALGDLARIKHSLHLEKIREKPSLRDWLKKRAEFPPERVIVPTPIAVRPYDPATAIVAVPAAPAVVGARGACSVKTAKKVPLVLPPAPVVPFAERRLAALLFTVGRDAFNAQCAKDGYRPFEVTWATLDASLRPSWLTIAAHVQPRLIEWHSAEDELPDDEVRCLLARDNADTDEAIFGYRADGMWFDDDGNRIAPDDVYAWAHAPAKPAKKGGAA